MDAWPCLILKTALSVSLIVSMILMGMMACIASSPAATPTPTKTPQPLDTPPPTLPGSDSQIITQSPTPAAAVPSPAPYCRPSSAAIKLSPFVRTLQIGQVVTVTVTLINGEDSGVMLGQPQYSLSVRPSDIMTPNNPRPVTHSVGIFPGELDEAAFVFEAVASGQVVLQGSASFEIHDLDDWAGSWSGCHSEPLEIVVTP